MGSEKMERQTETIQKDKNDKQGHTENEINDANTENELFESPLEIGPETALMW